MCVKSLPQSLIPFIENIQYLTNAAAEMHWLEFSELVSDCSYRSNVAPVTAEKWTGPKLAFYIELLLSLQ